MSCIYFHSKEKDVQVSGRERLMMGSFCTRITLAYIGDVSEYKEEKHWIRKILPKDSYLLRDLGSYSFQEAFRTWLYGAWHDSEFEFKDYSEPIFNVELNTVLKTGSDPVKLFARLHAQCESHCYVKQENTNWLADIIQEGLDIKFYIENYGWEKVIELLRKENIGTVVCSYSICDPFPNPSFTDKEFETAEEREEFWDSWMDLPNDKKWDDSVSILEGRDGKWGLELKPENWNEYYFGYGTTAMDLYKLSQEKDLPSEQMESSNER